MSEPSASSPDGPAPEAEVPPELRPAVDLFERGDFQAAATAARALLAGSPTPEVKAAALALLDRMAPDPFALGAGLGALALLALLVGAYVL